MDTPQLNKPRNKAAVVGKIVLIVVALAILVGIGVLIGKFWSNKSSNTTNNTTSEVTNEVANATNETSNTTANNTPSNTTTNDTADNTTNSTTNSTTTPTIPDNSTNLTITGKSPFVSYKTYFPNTWSWQKDHVGSAIKLTLTRGGFTVIISQAAGGNGTCVYPGDAASSDPMAAQFEEPTATVTGTSSTFRIAMQAGGGSAGTKHYSVCEKTSGDYKLATQYGYITVETPPEGATSGWSTNNASVQSILSLLTKQ